MTRVATALAVAALCLTAPAVLLAGIELGGQVSEPAVPHAPSYAMTLPADPITARVPVDPPTLERASRSVRLQPAPRPSLLETRSVAPRPFVRARHLAARANGTRRAMWDALVACEAPDRGWRYGAPGVGIDEGYHFVGGPNFERSTWSAYGGQGNAYDATPEQQIAVAELVLADQGWAAWPTCSRKLGYR